VLENRPEPLIVPTLVVTEVVYLLGTYARREHQPTDHKTAAKVLE
jgi:hypothetical protein